MQERLSLKVHLLLQTQLRNISMKTCGRFRTLLVEPCWANHNHQTRWKTLLDCCSQSDHSSGERAQSKHNKNPLNTTFQGRTEILFQDQLRTRQECALSMSPKPGPSYHGFESLSGRDSVR